MRKLLLLWLALFAASAPGAELERYDPLALNEQAAAALAAGDRELAAILLERAARLAPGDRRVADNLRALRGLPPLPAPPAAGAEAPVP